MEALLSLIPGGGLAAIGGLFIAGFLLVWRIFAAGKSSERAKQAQRDLKAKDEQLEMHREANAQERAARDLSDEEARKEANRWSKR